MTKNNIETATVTKMMEVANNKEIIKVTLKEWHSKLYLDNLKKTTYKDKEVVFILPDGKELKDEQR